jgi:hypothetical protein
MFYLLACIRYSDPDRIEPTFLEVTLAEGSNTGTSDSPLPFTSEGASFTLTVQALDITGKPYAMDGDLSIKVRPGKLEQDDHIRLQGGSWTGSVTIKNGFGPTRIWFVDEGDEDSSSTRPASHAVGVSAALNYAFPTIAEMQATTDTETNNLEKEFAELRVEDREVVVAARDAAGFWAYDTLDGPASYNGLYIYTFSRPDDELQVGARISLLTGNNQEYLATTQFSFPTVEVDSSKTLTPPDPYPITEESGCPPELVEKLESSRIILNGAQIPANFLENADYEDKYTNYQEWPLTLGSCTLYVISNSTAPDFDPLAYAGTTLPSISGMLKEIYGDPVLTIVDAADIQTTSGPPKR